MRHLTLCLLAVAACAPPSERALELPLLFQDGMVIQRNAPVEVWGWASGGDAVEVTLGNDAARTVADDSGTWRVTLPARPAGGPESLTVTTGTQTLRVEDILIGDVWIASGQSNMEWTVAQSADAEAEIARANDPQIRHFKVPHSWSFSPEERLAGGSWAPATPGSVGAFSAVGYYFARALREHVDVPIGLVNTSWGGSRIEPWMSAEMLGLSEAEVAGMEVADRERAEALQEAVVARVGEIPESDPGLVDGEPRWADPSLDTSDWGSVQAPGLWETQGLTGLDGVVWYRRSVSLSAEQAAGAATLKLAMIDDQDITWVNGIEVGRTEQYNAERSYEIPAGGLREGSNHVAVRVVDTGGGGGFHGSPDNLVLETAGGAVSLAGEWHLRVGEMTRSDNAGKNQVPTVLYNRMIRPLLPMRATGFLWYQGESNAGGADAVAYAGLFQDMIQGWRTDWNLPDAPFLWVQLANFMAARDEPSESDWAVLRESQSAALALPHTAQAVIIDIGEADDIHPRNKQDVGYRLSLAARALVYGDATAYRGPTYRDHTVEGSRVSVRFDHADGGLVARGGPPGGFALSGVDGRWYWAEAEIDGDRVVLRAGQVPNPLSVRYAWADNPDNANLYNGEGLPAVPFQAVGDEAR